MTYRTILIGKSPVPILSKQASKGQVYTLANFDILNPVYVSTEKAVQPNTSDAIAVPPLGSTPISGDFDTYAVSSIANGVSVGLIPGSGGWSPSPAQIATQLNALGLAKDTSVQAVNSTLGTPAQNSTVNGVITTLGTPAQDGTVGTVATNTTGVAKDTTLSGDALRAYNQGTALAHKSSVILNQAVNCPANANTQVGGTLTFTQHSFEMRLNFTWNVANGVVGYVVININWIDSNTGLITDVDTYVSIVASTTDTTGFFTRIAGPTKADTAKLFVNNLEAAAGRTVVCTALVLANSRALTGDSLDVPLLSPASATIVGTVGATGDSRYLLGVQNSALAVSATDTWLCTPGVGPIWLNVFETGVGGSNMQIKLRMSPNSQYSTTGNGAWLVNDIMGAGNPNKLSYSLYQAGGPMLFQITNGGSVAANYSAAIVRGQPLE